MHIILHSNKTPGYRFTKKLYHVFEKVTGTVVQFHLYPGFRQSKPQCIWNNAQNIFFLGLSAGLFKNSIDRIDRKIASRLLNDPFAKPFSGRLDN